MMKRVYKCDLCKEEKGKGQLFGLNFYSLTHFHVDSVDSTDGTHICKECMKQLKEEMPL